MRGLVMERVANWCSRWTENTGSQKTKKKPETTEMKIKCIGWMTDYVSLCFRFAPLLYFCYCRITMIEEWYSRFGSGFISSFDFFQFEIWFHVCYIISECVLWGNG